MLCAEEVGVEVGGQPLLSRVSVRVQPGRVLAVAGPNGAGKSTLLSVLAGLRAPDRGAVTLHGRPLATLDRLERARRCALLAQVDALSAPLLAREVVALGRHPHGDGPRYDVDAALAGVGASHLAHRCVDTLSGGERQRVHLARVLAQLDGPGEGGVLLLDEPTSALDLLWQQRVLATVRALATGRGVAVLVVLHDLNLAGRWADDLVLLRGGRCVASGPVDDVLRTGPLRAAFDIRAHVLAHPDHGRPQILVAEPAGALP